MAWRLIRFFDSHPLGARRDLWTSALALLPALAISLPPGPPLDALFGPAAASASDSSGGGGGMAGGGGAVTALVPRVCPADSRADFPDPSSPAAVDMLARLAVLMTTLVQLAAAASASATVAAAPASGGSGAVVATGRTGGGGGGDSGGDAHTAAAVSLLQSLLVVVQDMGSPDGGHLRQAEQQTRFVALAAAAWHGADAAAETAAATADAAGSVAAAASAVSAWPGAALLSQCWQWLLDPSHRPMQALRESLVRHVALPLLEAAPAAWRAEWLGRRLRELLLVHVMATAGAGGGGGPSEPQLVTSLCCFWVLEKMFRLCSVKEVSGSACCIQSWKGVNAEQYSQRLARVGAVHIHSLALCKEVRAHTLLMLPKGGLFYPFCCMIVADTALLPLSLHDTSAQSLALKIEYVYETVRTGGLCLRCTPARCLLQHGCRRLARTANVQTRHAECI